MRRRRLARGLVAPAALLLLVGALATLQYRWVGQVSEAERDQLRESLDRRAQEFATDFDHEISLAYQSLQPGAGTFDPAKPDALIQRYDRWLTSARFPGIVKAIYYAQSVPSGFTLFRYEPDQKALQPIEWPTSLDPVKTRLTGMFDHVMPALPGNAKVIAFASLPVVIDVPALVIPAPIELERTVEPRRSPGRDVDMLTAMRLAHSYLVVELDAEHLKQHVLPELAARHFPATGADRYRVAIVDAKSEPVMTRGLEESQRLDPEHADAVAPFFTIRLDAFQDATMTWTMSKSGRTGGPAGTVIARPPGTTAGRFSVVVEQRALGSSPPAGRRVSTGGHWKVLLQHSAGSLDAAVSEVRRRNLWLSFGILTVLAMSVGLIVINARRSERLAAQQMDFVATVSHELRTPLAVIRSAAQNLSAGVVHDAGQARRYGDLIEDEGRRLTDMIEQVLEYAGLSGNRHPVQSRPVDAGAVVKDVLSSCSSLFEAERFEVGVDVAADLPVVLADEGALRRALHNLVTNALKYAADGRWLGVKVSRAMIRGQDELQIVVSDRGRGIAAEDLGHIFEPFYRGRYALDRQIHGNGLGLSLVKRIAEAHGGRITVASSPGQGAAFTLHLPAASADQVVNAIGEPAADAGPTA